MFLTCSVRVSYYNLRLRYVTISCLSTFSEWSEHVRIGEPGPGFDPGEIFPASRISAVNRLLIANPADRFGVTTLTAVPSRSATVVESSSTPQRPVSVTRRNETHEHVESEIFFRVLNVFLRVGQYKIVCYFTNWAWYRPSPGKFFPEDTDPNLCTHVVYGFATLDYTDLVIRVFDTWADIDNGTCAIRPVYLSLSPGRGVFFQT